jgi:hypothetical protein
VVVGLAISGVGEKLDIRMGLNLVDGLGEESEILECLGSFVVMHSVSSLLNLSEHRDACSSLRVLVISIPEFISCDNHRA